MAIHRGIQSALFYYLACTPCADARYRKNRKKQAERDRADKELLEAQMPNLYRHPSPSSTNPHWQAEIALGPLPTARGKRKTPTSDSQRGLKTSATQSTNDSNVASSVDVGRMASPEERLGSRGSNRQRPDEDLWGSTASEPQLRNFLDGSSAESGLARPQKARVRDSQSYQSSRNPSINDYHPATVTRVSSRDDAAWMLQPPPIAEVMSGKEEPAIRCASNSGSSRQSVMTSSSISRPASRRLQAPRLPSGESSVSGSSRDSPGKLKTSPQGQRHDRSSGTLAIEERDFATTPRKRAKRKPTPIKVLRDSEDSAATVVRHPSLAPEPVTKPRKVASRPQLSTILSDSIISSDHEPDFYTPVQTPKENRALSSEDSTAHRDKTTRRSAVLVSDSSLKALQDLTPKSPIFNTQIFATSPALVESKIRLPRPSGDEERTLTGATHELYDSWYTPDFELGEWVREHTKREVKQRWSMDI